MSKSSPRAAGTGSIYRRSDGLYVAQVDAGRDKNGKRRILRKAFKKKGDAADSLNTMLAELAGGKLVVDRKTTLADYVKQWLPAVTPTLAPKTLVGYEFYAGVVAEGTLGKSPLAKLTGLQVQRYYAQLRDEGRSTSWISHLHAVLRAALGDAVEWQILPFNPALAVKVGAPAKREAPIWTIDQMRAFLNAIKDDRDEALFVLAMVTGARAGELLGLSWDDIDTDRKTITLRRQAQRLPEQGVVLRDTLKGKKGRTITLLDPVLDHLTRQQTRVVALGKNVGFVDRGLIFPNRQGGPRDDHSARIKLQKLCGALKIPVVRFHDLRHLSASFLVAKGVSAKVIQERLGHSSIQMTMDRYSHLMQGLDAQAAEAFAELFASS